MKPMLLTSVEELPVGDEWIYEAKYDGYRAILVWENEIPTIISRNGNELTPLFPELIEFCKRYFSFVKSFLPLTIRLYSTDNNDDISFTLSNG